MFLETNKSMIDLSSISHNVVLNIMKWDDINYTNYHGDLYIITDEGCHVVPMVDGKEPMKMIGVDMV